MREANFFITLEQAYFGSDSNSAKAALTTVNSILAHPRPGSFQSRNRFCAISWLATIETFSRPPTRGRCDVL